MSDGSDHPHGVGALGDHRHRVVIAGGGVAAVELAGCLADRAGDRVHLTLLAPEADFRDRPWGADPLIALDQGEPLSLARVSTVLGAALISDRLAWVQPEAGAVHTAGGRRLGYDSLAVCVGAAQRSAHPHALSFEGWRDPRLGALLDAVRAGRIRRVAVVIGERPGWPLPLYELALTLAAPAPDAAPGGVQVTVLTAERQPLEVFGTVVSREVRALLSEHGVRVIAGARCTVPTPQRVTLTRRQPPYDDEPGQPHTIDVDAVIALPDLIGPLVRGLPCAPHGFVPVDRFCRVPGRPGVFAAGDAVAFPVKHGGIAAQQADVAAAGIAARAGAAITPDPLHARLEGILRTADGPRFIRADLVGGQAFGSRYSREPLWDQRSKVIAAHLTPVLERARA